MKIKNKSIYFNGFTVTLYILAFISLLITVFSRLFATFADFVNYYISAPVRFVVSHITGVLPFSLAETIVILLPLIVFLLIFLYFKLAAKDDVLSSKYLMGCVSILLVMFIMFGFTFSSAYGCTTLDKRLGIERKDVSGEELALTARLLLDEIDDTLDEINYISSGASVMPLSIEQLNTELNHCYKSIAQKHTFVPKLTSKVKVIALSEPMTYTHISGVFTYYTCEANVNINFPDYDKPFTMAHEMAHQRGFAREDEANFMAFLVCLESDDPYVRYSALVGVYEYVTNALYSADFELYSEVINETDMRIIGEMRAFNEFFEKYSTSKASTVTDTVNDTWLKASGQSAGSKSYGLVVDLVCAYYSEP